MPKTSRHLLLPFICLFLFAVFTDGGQNDQPSETARQTLIDILDSDGPLYDIIYDLEECYDRHMEILQRAEEDARSAREKAYQEFWQKLEDLTTAEDDETAHRQRDALARLGRDVQRLASEYDLQALFPDSPAERNLRCRHHLRMARLRLQTARQLNEAYREVLARRNAEKYFPKQRPQDWEFWQQELDRFVCRESEERPALQTQVEIPAGSRRFFVLKTFCLDRNKLGPDDGQKLRVVGNAADLSRVQLQQLLKEAATYPAREIDIQQAIWDESTDEEENRSKALKATPSGDSGAAGGTGSLTDAVASGTINADMRIREDFTSVDMWLENSGDTDVTVDVSGAVFGTGEEGVQRVGAAGVDSGQPPPGPAINSPERTLEEIRDEVARQLEEAMERVRDGDHSEEALKELAEAMAAARNVGLEEPLNDAWNTFRDGLWEKTTEDYDAYKKDPSDASKKQVLEDLETVRQVDPPAGKEDQYNSMLEDLLGIPSP